MASGGHVDRIAAEFGIHFIHRDGNAVGRHQSKARRTCQKLLDKHGPAHLRQVLAMINTSKNRGRWDAPTIKAVSGLIEKRGDLLSLPGFLSAFDQVDLAEVHANAKRANPGAPTVAMMVLLSYEVDRLIKEERNAA
jgi:hypothetical protein